MTQKNIFRLFVAIYLALEIGSALAGVYTGVISEDWKTVLEWNGNGGYFELLTDSTLEQTFFKVVLFIVLVIFLAIAVTVQIGMFLFWRFARIGYLVSTLAFGLIVLFDGLVVMVPIQASLYDLTLILDGIIIAMSYLQPFKGFFEFKNT
jgi:hypothetical protein